MELADPAGERPRLGWFCTYTPEELLYAAGWHPERIIPKAGEADTASSWFSSNLCPYVRQVGWRAEQGGLDHLQGVVVTNSCHAMLQLASALETNGFPPVYVLDVPRKDDAAAVNYFASQLRELARALCRGQSPAEGASLQAAVQAYQERRQWLEQVTGGSREGWRRVPPGWLWEVARSASARLPGQLAAEEPGGSAGSGNGAPCLLLTGAMPFPEMMEVLLQEPGISWWQDNCLVGRYLERPQPENSEEKWREEPFIQLAQMYLHKPPCPRMQTMSRRRCDLQSLMSSMPFRGVVFHDLGFCDLHHYDYLLVEELCREQGLPLLRLKTEMHPGEVGQIRTRVEAFLEMVT